MTSSVVSVNSTLPWNTSEADVIFTSRDCSSEDRTPVVTRSEMPCLSSWRVSFSISSAVASPLTELALEAFLEAAREAGVFFSLPAAARLASRAAFDAETMVLYEG